MMRGTLGEESTSLDPVPVEVIPMVNLLSILLTACIRECFCSIYFHMYQSIRIDISFSTSRYNFLKLSFKNVKTVFFNKRLRDLRPPKFRNILRKIFRHGDPSVNYYDTAIAEITAPGEPYETTTITVRGTDFIGFKHAPQNLLEIYRFGLEHAQDDFYVYQKERFTYAEAWRIAAKVANTLLNSDFQFGDRVGISLRNYPEWIWAFMGITAVGGVATALNAWWTSTEMCHAIKDSGLTLLVVDGERYARIKDYIDELGLTVITVRAGDQPNTIEWQDWIAAAADEMPNLHVPSALPATLLYTSGSTATPKGVLSSHQALTHALLGWEAGAIINWRAAQIKREHQGQGDTMSGRILENDSLVQTHRRRMRLNPLVFLRCRCFTSLDSQSKC